MEKGGDDGFYFDDEDGTKGAHEAVLKHKHTEEDSSVGASARWAGWVLKDSPLPCSAGTIDCSGAVAKIEACGRTRWRLILCASFCEWTCIPRSLSFFHSFATICLPDPSSPDA